MRLFALKRECEHFILVDVSNFLMNKSQNNLNFRLNFKGVHKGVQVKDRVLLEQLSVETS